MAAPPLNDHIQVTSQQALPPHLPSLKSSFALFTSLPPRKANHRHTCNSLTSANMAFGGGVALKGLSWFLRVVEFCCAAIILGIFCYFLATLHNHGLHIETYIRAVTGISGAGVLYTIFALLFVCCLGGNHFPLCDRYAP